MTGTTRLALIVATTCSAALLAPARHAHACGGCFTPPVQPTEGISTVESHRMIIELSPEQTILWDQIRYSGNPADFVWVLPVPTPDAQVELADATFFDELDSQTAPRVQPAYPLYPCGGGSGCGDAAAAGTDAVDHPYQPDDPVTVYSEDTVGPYETVIIGSEDAGALRTWLVDHGYQVGAETEPIIDHYIEHKSVFVVLRLAPDQGVQAMQPVRVRYPGYMARFPLEMVTVGAYGVVGLTLWVIAEQRYEARNYATRTIDQNRLSWDWSTNKSNYAELFDQTIQEAGGRAWIVEQASPLVYLYFSSPEAQLVYGLQPYPYVTRMRTNILVDHVSDDLELGPASDWSNVASGLYAYTEYNRPSGGNCNQVMYGCSGAAMGARFGQTFGPLALVLLVLGWRRHRAQRRAHATPRG